MTPHHLLDLLFRASVYRAFHFIPLWLDLLILAGLGLALLTWYRRT